MRVATVGTLRIAVVGPQVRLTQPRRTVMFTNGRGAVVFVCDGHRAYDVDFVSGDGVTLGVLTLVREDVRPLAGGEILHARKTSG